MSLDLSVIRKVASKEAYRETYFNGNSKVISFCPRHDHPTYQKGGTPTRINIYWTTGTVAATLSHPRQGKTQLFRRDVDALQLRFIFKNPRIHTGSGYYRSSKVLAPLSLTNNIRGCQKEFVVGDKAYVNGFGVCTIKSSLLRNGSFTGRIQVKSTDGEIQHVSPNQLHVYKNVEEILNEEAFCEETEARAQLQWLMDEISFLEEQKEQVEAVIESFEKKRLRKTTVEEDWLEPAAKDVERQRKAKIEEEQFIFKAEEAERRRNTMIEEERMKAAAEEEKRQRNEEIEEGLLIDQAAAEEAERKRKEKIEEECFRGIEERYRKSKIEKERMEATPQEAERQRNATIDEEAARKRQEKIEQKLFGFSADVQMTSKKRKLSPIAGEKEDTPQEEDKKDLRREIRGKHIEHKGYHSDHVYKHFNEDVISISCGGTATIMLYENGNWDFTSGLPDQLAIKLNGRSKALPPPVYVVLGSLGRYYIRFKDGNAEWAGCNHMTKKLKYCKYKKVRSVAFGQYWDSYFVVFDDGSSIYKNIPNELIDLLRRRLNRDDLTCVSLGPKGEYFLSARNTKTWYGGLIEYNVNCIKESGNGISFMDFGDDDSYVLRSFL